MSSDSKIEWTEKTWNPVTGCTKVSAGCKHCYAERMWPRLNGPGRPYAGRAFGDVQCHPERLGYPPRWRKPARVFVNSMSDLFHDDVPDEFILSVFHTMAITPKHTYQILTKRPERMLSLLSGWRDSGLTLREGCRSVLPNVWLGVSVENQATADERIPLLLQTPAAVRFVSCEPLLGPVRLDKITDDELGAKWDALSAGLHWVIVGGESGPRARPMHPDWARSLRDQCASAGVPFFFKQWGEWAPNMQDIDDYPDPLEHGATLWPDGRVFWAPELGTALDGGCTFAQLGKRRSGRLLDGRTWGEYPRA
jgi:protein gp37